MKPGVKRSARRGVARRRSAVRAIAIGVLTVVALAACGSGGDAGSGSSGGSGDSADVARSQDLLDKAHAAAVTGPSVGVVPTADIVPWKASDMPAPTAPPSGPLHVDVMYSFPAGFPPYAAGMVKALGEKLGWTVNVFGASTPTQQGALAAMQQAVLDKPDAIIAIATPATWVSPALDEARKDGIYTIDVNQDSSTGKGYDAYVPGAKGVQKALVGAWAVAKSEGTAHTVLFEAPGFTDVNVPAAKDYLDKCSGCAAEVQSLNSNAFVDPTQTQSSVSAALSNRSSVDYVVWPTGGLQLTPVLNGISTSRNRDAELIVDEPSAENMQLLAAGKIPVVVQAPAVLLLLEAIDNVNRLVQSKGAIPEGSLRPPVSYWTQGDAPHPTFSAITEAQLAANDWLTPFEEAWHVQLKNTILGVSG